MHVDGSNEDIFRLATTTFANASSLRLIDVISSVSLGTCWTGMHFWPSFRCFCSSSIRHIFCKSKEQSYGALITTAK